MKKRTFYIVLMMLLLSCDRQSDSRLSNSAESSVDRSQKIAEIGKLKITAEKLKNELAALPGGQARASRPGGHRAELERLIELMVAEEEGAARKINEDPLYQQRLAEIKAKARRQERELMYNMLFQKISETATITDEQINAYYEKHKNRFLTSRIHLRRITTKSKEEMEAAQKKLSKGESFEKVASVFNMDEKLRQSGGDMGSLLRNELSPGLRVAAFRLQNENEISQAFESDGAWNLLQLVKKENSITRPLEEVKDQLVRELQRTQAKQNLDQALNTRREQLGVTIYEDEVAKLGPPGIPPGARVTKAASQIKVPEAYQSNSGNQGPKQAKSSLDSGAMGH